MRTLLSTPMRVAVFVLLTLAPCAPAAAQRAPRDGGAVFGSGPRRPSAHTLDVRFSALESADTDLLDGSAPPDAGRTATAGTSSQLQASAQWKWTGRRFSAGGGIGSVSRYYPALRGLFTTSNNADANIGAALGARTSIGASMSGTYGPQHSLTPLIAPGPTDPSAESPVDWTLSAHRRTTVSGTAELKQQFGRTAATATFGTRHSSTAAGMQDLRSQSAGGVLTRRVSRSLGLRAGYRREGGATAAGTNPVSIHDLDVGLDFSRPLSFSRRTTVAFRSGSALAASKRDRTFQLTGVATLRHEMGRTWATSLSYQRGVRLVEGFVDPVVANTASATVDGMLTRRSDLSVSLGYAVGAAGIQETASTFDTYNGSVRVRYALTRRLAAFGEYSAFFYQFSSGSGRPAGFAPQADRHSARIGLSVWLPLLGTAAGQGQQ